MENTNAWGFLDGFVNNIGAIAGKGVDAYAQIQTARAQEQARTQATLDQRPAQSATMTASFGGNNLLLWGVVAAVVIGAVVLIRRR